MSETINNDGALAEESSDKGTAKASINFFNNIIGKVDFQKFNQHNSLLIVLFCIYFFVLVLLIILNPPTLRNFNYSIFLGMGLFFLLLYTGFFIIIGNLKKSKKSNKPRRKNK